MTSVRILFVLSLSIPLVGCLSVCPSSDSDEGKNICIERVRALSREKWVWGVETAFGIPTIELKPLEGLMISGFVFRVTVANKDFVFGSGPRTITATCVVRGEHVVFLETDDDVVGFMSPVDESSLNAKTILTHFETFAKLRGLELQVGLPTDANPWVVSNSRDSHMLRLFEFSNQDPRQWEVVIDRSFDGWLISGTLVSPSSFQSSRYVILITERGRIKVKNVDVVYAIKYM